MLSRSSHIRNLNLAISALQSRAPVSRPACKFRTTHRRAAQRAAVTTAAMAPNVFNPGGDDAERPAEKLPFISRRSPVLGKRGMVACSQPLAAEVLQAELCPMLSVHTSIQSWHSQASVSVDPPLRRAGRHAHSAAGRQCGRRGGGCGSSTQRHRAMLHRSGRLRVLRNGGALALVILDDGRGHNMT